MSPVPETAEVAKANAPAEKKQIQSAVDVYLKTIKQMEKKN